MQKTALTALCLLSTICLGIASPRAEPEPIETVTVGGQSYEIYASEDIGRPSTTENGRPIIGWFKQDGEWYPLIELAVPKKAQNKTDVSDEKELQNKNTPPVTVN